MRWTVPVLALVLAGCGGDAFDCTMDTSCRIGSIYGKCLDSQTGGARYCAFGDSQCATGYRWGDSAGDGLASQCVMAIGADMNAGVDLEMAPDLGSIDDRSFSASDMSISGLDLVVIGGNTGAPCTKDADCAFGLGPNQKGLCILTTGPSPNVVTWPMGYCTTPCRMNHTDTTSGINADCPGGGGTCFGSGSTGECRTLCANGSASLDCRPGYSCFFADSYGDIACAPTAMSQCAPSKAGSCAASDAGVAQTCANAGDGTVGVCLRACDPFTPGAANGCDPNDPNGQTACHASTLTGEGFCDNVLQGAAQGSTCSSVMTYSPACPDGMACNAFNQCQPYCRDSGPTCPMFNGKTGTCTKLPGATNLTTAQIGVCQY